MIGPLVHDCLKRDVPMVVEVAGIEPASPSFSVGLLRAQPVLDCQDHHRYRRQRSSVSD